MKKDSLKLYILTHKKKIIFFFIGFICISYCLLEQTIIYQPTTNCKKIQVGEGAEDIVLNKKNNTLLISSHNRRLWNTPGAIFSYHTKKKKVTQLKRVNEPPNLIFHPQGIYFVPLKFKKSLLFIVSHGTNKMSSKQASILVYKLSKNKLIFKSQHTHEQYLTSPNSILGFKDGSFYVTNDVDDRSNVLELSGFKFKSTLVYYNAGHNKWKFIKTGLKFANGIEKVHNKVFVTLSRDDTMLSFDLLNNNKIKFKKKIPLFKGADNLRTYQNNLILTEHPSNFKFTLHLIDSFFNSPSKVWIFNTEEEKYKLLYSTSGREISAISTGLIHNNTLYMGQVFGNFILKCPL